VAERRAQLVEHLLGDFSPSERATLASMLERFVGSVDDFVARLDPRERTESA
jgi:peptidyl-tRNA hydrolase